MLKQFKAFLRRQRLQRAGIKPLTNLPVKRFGDRTGVWTVFDPALGNDSVVYSFGVGNNIAWDLAMIEEYGLEIFAFDPTPRCVDWIAEQDLPPQFHFTPTGLADYDGELKFFIPRKPTAYNFSSHAAEKTSGETVACPVERFLTIANRLGHSRVDVLKMDIEGAEQAALPDVLSSGIEIGQILIEFHYNYPTISFTDFLNSVELLRKHGFEFFDVSPRGYEFSLVHESLVNNH
ncbi:FkbM family methyltransferase [Calycomorphotria hydatis]|uniref:Methyltransferase FkbM domain-containing protein n=1 Tax=Calycomorphotria hydatis TaxID=2528027 RepID=A0A517TF83_9PLAN|nr:FkbM family methyltransferase [Calycomorphotria hydatis]QDT67036.1 hypothetical protein V22_43080 [Calycomorphotria hydatis]